MVYYSTSYQQAMAKAKLDTSDKRFLSVPAGEFLSGPFHESLFTVRVMASMISLVSTTLKPHLQAPGNGGLPKNWTSSTLAVDVAQVRKMFPVKAGR